MPNAPTRPFPGHDESATLVLLRRPSTEEAAVLDQPERPDDYARATITHALRSHPDEVWTTDALAARYGISTWRTMQVLGELSAAGVILRLDGPDDEFTAA
jgi:hypothetical protein